MESSVKGWIEGNESAKEMLVRVLTERPFLLIPPLHRVPLRVGNVVEVVGPSPSAKTDILIQAAISCILPKEWNGLQYGGLERLVVFLDLDCRFDILRLSKSLKHRIMEANGSETNVSWERNDVNVSHYNSKKEPLNDYNKELFAACMRRFLYVRCNDSFEFLATLKTMHYQLQKERETHGSAVHLLLIDSIGAFYWMDRALPSLPVGVDNRKNFSLQTASETIVQEIRKLLMVHPMLVLATKVASLQDKYSRNEIKRSPKKGYSHNALDLRTVKGGYQNLPYREYMPSVWQSLVTHRILVRASGLHADDDNKHQDHATYMSEWLLPSLSLTDKFIVGDAGVLIVS